MSDTPDTGGQKRLRQLGPLHDLLIRASGFDLAGCQSIAQLASQVGYTPQAMYNIIRKNKIAPRAAQLIVEASEKEAARLSELAARGVEVPEYSPVTRDDFTPYIFQ